MNKFFEVVSQKWFSGGSKKKQKTKVIFNIILLEKQNLITTLAIKWINPKSKVLKYTVKLEAGGGDRSSGVLCWLAGFGGQWWLEAVIEAVAEEWGFGPSWNVCLIFNFGQLGPLWFNCISGHFLGPLMFRLDLLGVSANVFVELWSNFPLLFPMLVVNFDKFLDKIKCYFADKKNKIIHTDTQGLCANL